MSYILDALRKSEQERRQGEIPHIESVHTPHPSSPPPNLVFKRLKWIFLTSIFIVAGAVFITWYWQNNLTDTMETVLPEPPAHPSSAKETITVQTASNRLIQNDPAETREAPPALAQESEAVAQNREGQAAPLPLKEPIPQRNTEEIDTIPNFSQLPSQLQAEIPELSFAGHTYSTEPSRRMIIINNKIMREGGRIAQQLKLKEITWEGVILEFNSTEFQIVLGR